MLYGIVPLVFCVLMLLLLRVRLPSLVRIESALATKWPVLAIGIVSALGFGYEWSTLQEIPLVHDEAAVHPAGQALRCRQMGRFGAHPRVFRAATRSRRRRGWPRSMGRAMR